MVRGRFKVRTINPNPNLMVRGRFKVRTINGP